MMGLAPLKSVKLYDISQKLDTCFFFVTPALAWAT